MTFTPEQTAALSGPLDRKHVKERQQAGQSRSYVEGWHVIAEANRIFGFDGWTRQTIQLDCVHAGERPDGKATVTYLAQVRIVVGRGDDMVIRDGTGTGHGIAKGLGDAHESAMKEAETDAMKRALMTFGNPFGLALYDKTQANVEAAPDPAEEARKAFARLKDQIGQVANVRALDTLMTGAAKTLEDMPEVGRNALMDLASKRRDEMEKAA
jgi:DNA recombination protein Rad52